MTQTQMLEQLSKLIESGALAKLAKTGGAGIADKLARKDKAILAGFKRKGIKDAVLMDRNDKSKAFNVRPFKGWLALGRVVRKGEHGVKGLFHVSQTEKVEKPAA